MIDLIDEYFLLAALKMNKKLFQLIDFKAAFIQNQKDKQDTNQNYGWRVGTLIWLLNIVVFWKMIRQMQDFLLSIKESKKHDVK